MRKARITLSGSGNEQPTIGVFSNSIGSFVATRESTGVYYLTCTGAFPGPDAGGNPRTWINQRTAFAKNDGGVITTEVYRINDDTIQISTEQDLTPVDYVQVSIEIRTR